MFFLPLYSSVIEFRSWRRTFQWFFAPYLDTHTVLILGRKPGLPNGCTLQEMADDSEPVIAAGLERLGLDRADVLGMSLGGLIALHYAARFPDQVDHLVVVAAGGRLSTEAGAKLPDVKARVREKKWFQPLWTMVDLNFTGPLRNLLRPLLLFGLPVLPFVRIPTRDFLISVAAVEEMNLTAVLPCVMCPALL
ncbi:MAG TPA: alpha/beta hydrolase, partial [Sphingomonadales bacterium]|nr:alpha/beta hydrolase [Sphingomonadales bacterium]